MLNLRWSSDRFLGQSLLFIWWKAYNYIKMFSYRFMTDDAVNGKWNYWIVLFSHFLIFIKSRFTNYTTLQQIANDKNFIWQAHLQFNLQSQHSKLHIIKMYEPTDERHAAAILKISTKKKRESHQQIFIHPEIKISLPTSVKIAKFSWIFYSW